MILQGYEDAPMWKWVVSDDWSLTRIVKPRRWTAVPLQPSLPAKYFLSGSAYATRTDTAAARWNNGVGYPVLQKTTNSSQAKITFTGSYLGVNAGQYFGEARYYPSTGLWVIDVNKSWLDAWIDPPFRYGFEGRESIIGHEIEHALGLDHTGLNCNMMATYGKPLAWICSTSSPAWGDIKKIQILYP